MRRTLAAAATLLTLVLSLPGPVFALPDGTWHRVPVAPADLGPREKHSIVFDPVRQRFIAFGGQTLPAGTIFNDVWVRPASSTMSWERLVVTGTPPSPRSFHSAVYDPVGDRMLVFGGDGGGPTNDLWALELDGTPAWTPVATSGSPPAARFGHSALFDAARNRMIVFGGQFGGSSVYSSNETWFLDLGSSPPAWSLVAISGPLPDPRSQHCAILDSAHDRMVVYGGAGFYFFHDVWTLSLGESPAWTLRIGLSEPSASYGASAVYDLVGDRMIMHGGYGSDDETWVLDLSSFTWLAVQASPYPGYRFNSAMAFNPSSRKAILQGGGPSSSNQDTWQLTTIPLITWTRVLPQAVPPGLARRCGAAGFYDAARDRFLLTGGGYQAAGPPTVFGDLAELQIGRDSAWIAVPDGSSFGPRIWHTAIHDPVRDRALIFGGWNGGLLGDVQEIRLSPSISVAPIEPLGAPPSPRDYHAAVYDPVRDRMIVFGGYDGFVRMNDLWALELSGTPTWTPIVPAAGPAPVGRILSKLVYDPWADRLLLFGGHDGTNFHNDLWSLSLGGTPTWTLLTPAGAPPAARHGAAWQVDVDRERVLLQGGGSQSDVWELRMSAGLEWHRLWPEGANPGGRYGHLGLYDPVNDRLLVSGGTTGSSTFEDVWRLQFAGATTAVEDDTPAVPHFWLGGFSPNPARGKLRVAFSVRDRAPAKIELLDVSGRRLAAHEIDSPSPGQATIAIAPEPKVRPGLYFIRLTQAGRSVTKRGIVVR